VCWLDANFDTIRIDSDSSAESPVTGFAALMQHRNQWMRLLIAMKFLRCFLGVPDPFIDDGNLANGGTFANNFSNSSGGDYTNSTSTGLGRRRMELGAKIVF
jgi:hypothetical protein